MDDKEKLVIEKTVRKCVEKLKNVEVTEKQIKSMLSRLYSMKDLKTVMDSLALSVSNFLEDQSRCKILMNA